MTELPPRPYPQRPPPRRGRLALRALLGLLALVLAFGLGLALGKALEEGPHPGGTQTLVRTLEPLPQSPSR